VGTDEGRAHLWKTRHRKNDSGGTEPPSEDISSVTGTTGGYAPPMKGSLPWSRGRDTALYRSRWQVELLFKRFK